ncbi:hypothetical protein [Burkholderia vietnamiensis]|uniref:hypothetical protein n=1 Tax=Burkholderia vietnamiensis TaxID=60552 RepID=UPI001D15B7CE|nr:hypothetical protein [Burkholderia vietnamiensis]UEC00060.1 hypothetical protein LK462_15635 [Burkholderia vietnamiensis]
MNALFCQKAKLGAVDALLNDSLAAKSSNPRPQGERVTIWLGLRTRVRFRIPPPTDLKRVRSHETGRIFLPQVQRYASLTKCNLMLQQQSRPCVGFVVWA